MRIVHIRKQPNTYIEHFSEGIVVFDNSDRYICSDFSSLRSFTIENIYQYLNYVDPYYLGMANIYDAKVVCYADLLKIPNVDIVIEYHSSSYPELFI